MKIKILFTFLFSSLLALEGALGYPEKFVNFYINSSYLSTVLVGIDVDKGHCALPLDSFESLVSSFCDRSILPLLEQMLYKDILFDGQSMILPIDQTLGTKDFSISINKNYNINLVIAEESCFTKSLPR